MDEDLQNEYLEYDIDRPRRSVRQRSITQHYVPAAVTHLSIERDARRRRTMSRTRSRSRDPSQPRVKTARDSFEENLAAQNFFAGVIRIPLRTEVCEIALFVTEMRRLQIECFRQLIEQLERKGNPKFDAALVTMKEAFAILEWEMDPRNIRPTDLPALDNPDNVYADISTWVNFFFIQCHEIPHRTHDAIIRAQRYVTAAEFRVLKSYKIKIEKKMGEYEEYVKNLKLTGHSLLAYKRLRDNYRAECRGCRK